MKKRTILWAIFNFIWGQVSVTHFQIFLAKRLAAHAEHAERIAMLEAKTAAMRAAEKEVTK